MKVTSLKDMENYIYSSVILPLKGLIVDSLNYSSPITDREGNSWLFLLGREEINEEFHHNFQRDEARERARYLVFLKDRRHKRVVADVDHRKNVVIYREGFRTFEGGKILMNKLEMAFRDHTPFNKVTVVEGGRGIYSSSVRESTDDPTEGDAVGYSITDDTPF